MNEPLINILIRVSRPQLFERCLDSVMRQTYKNIALICHSDNPASFTALLEARIAFDQPLEKIDRFKIIKYYSSVQQAGFFYNLYLNTLKNKVTEGWWCILDDDDILANENVLQDISLHLTDPDQPVICQFLRNGRPKQGDIYMDKKWIMKGHIGMPCLFLHSKHKDIAEFQATEDADYLFIKTVSEKLKCKFVKRVLVDAGSRSHGQPQNQIL